MTRYNGALSDEDRKEIYESNCGAYQGGYISLIEFTAQLALIGMNATDIAEAEQFYRPAIAPENDGD